MGENSRAGQLAILIDGDNASHKIIAALLAKASQYGTANVKRVYGDWTSANLNGWKECLVKYALQPIQQFAYAKGKNATDIAMVIDAMDLLHSGRFSGFCLVSSDSDFTRLAVRLREQGMSVYGFGKLTTIPSFVAACDTFTYVEHLTVQPAKVPVLAPVAAAAAAGVQPPRGKEVTHDLVKMLRTAVEALADKDGRAHLGPVGTYLAKQSPGFVSQNFGYKRLSDLAKASGILDVELIGAQKTMMVSLKAKSARG